MKVLLDTHILLWALSRTQKLDPVLRDALEDLENIVFYSVVSIWEIGIKAALQRDDFKFDPEEVLTKARSTGFTEVSITSELTLTATRLPMHHRDPFDRLLVAQALAESALLVTADRKLTLYSETVWLV